MSPILQTERLVLRAPRADDAARIAALAGDIQVSRMVAQIPHPYPPEAAEGWLWLLDLRRRRGHEHVFALSTQRDGLIGVTGAHRRNGSDMFEVGYWLGRSYWGQGYATEGVGALVGWLQRELRQTRLTASHFRDNPASARVLEKLGFRHTGRVTPRYCLARDAQVDCRDMLWTADGPELEAA